MLFLVLITLENIQSVNFDTAWYRSQCKLNSLFDHPGGGDMLEQGTAKARLRVECCFPLRNRTRPRRIRR